MVAKLEAHLASNNAHMRLTLHDVQPILDFGTRLYSVLALVLFLPLPFNISADFSCRSQVVCNLGSLFDQLYDIPFLFAGETKIGVGSCFRFVVFF